MNSKPISVVTGGTGFVGSHLVDLLLEKNHEVRCIVRKTSNLQWLKGKDVKIYDCGLDDKEQLVKVLEGANYIYHVAGVVKSKKKEGYYKGNVDVTENILEAALKIKDTLKRLVVVSSQTAAGPSFDAPVTEDDIPNPITTYGKSKLAQEQLTAKYFDKLPITICRPPAVYGERDTDVFLIFKTFKSGIMTMIGFDKKKVSLIHVRDLVEGIYEASISVNTVSQTYFITSKEVYDWYQFGEITSKVMNKKAIKVKVPHSLVYILAAISEFFALFSKQATIFNLEKARDIVQKNWTCSHQKALKDFGWEQKISLEEGIKRTVSWYKENNWL